MGFFRDRPRTADVEAEADTVLHSLTRAGYRRTMDDDPAFALGFLQSIVRTLSNRIEFANAEIASLV